jgi:endonuclease YncB( thermonuclease family)
MKTWRAGLAALLVAAGVPAAAGQVLGPARVVDGDTVAIGTLTIRLLSIDAPERAQTCTGADGRETLCGREATLALERLIGERELLCEGERTDAGGRLLARCDAGSGDIARLMVLAGQAVVFIRFSDDYAAEEALARKAGRGLWAGSFEMPWDWRASRWQSAAQTAPRPDCPIKGNIAKDGERIYHLPSNRDYLRTRIDEAKGERWFCDEAEAVRAGWRPALR